MNALVTLSGGQDSATCLFYATENYERVEAVSFDYGQRHRVELDCAKRLATIAGVKQHVLSIPALTEIGAASLTNPDIESKMDAADTGNVYAEKHGLPSSFVPARNVILLGTAAALAAPRGLDTIVTGICATDEQGYPDCRPEFAASMQETLRHALDEDSLHLDTPLLYLSKAQTWRLAQELGRVDTIVHHSHTCYNGDHVNLHEWGYGCGECPACEVRAEGWREFKARVA